MNLELTFELLLILICIIDGAMGSRQLKILGLFPHPGRSHFQFFHPIMRGLADAGHDVTIISHFPDKSPSIRYRDIPLSNTQSLQETVDLQIIEKRTFYQHFIEFFLLYEWGKDACNLTLRSSALDRIIREKNKYDIILTEMFNTDCMMGIAHILKAPVIALSSCALMPWHYERIGAPMIPSYVPTLFLGVSEHMNFFQRLGNWISFHILNLMYQYYSVTTADALLHHKFGQDLPSVRELVKDTAMFIVNQHFSLSGAKPLPPNVLELGGVHIDKAKPLDIEIQRFLDNAVDGVILISWGSMVRANTLSENKRDSILRAIKRLNQKVIWKWEDDAIENKPENLMIKKWVQQRDILCHPNLKVFMTHGGLLGSSEAAYCGVPVVVTPMYGDQFLNAAALENRGMGVTLKYEEIKESTVLKAIKKAMERSMMDSAKAVSLSYKHRPLSPIQTAVWWVEYVAKTKGAPLARGPAPLLPFYVHHSLDVYLTIVIMIVLLWRVWMWTTRKILMGIVIKKNLNSKKKQ